VRACKVYTSQDSEASRSLQNLDCLAWIHESMSLLQCDYILMYFPVVRCCARAVTPNMAARVALLSKMRTANNCSPYRPHFRGSQSRLLSAKLRLRIDGRVEICSADLEIVRWIDGRADREGEGAHMTDEDPLHLGHNQGGSRRQLIKRHVDRSFASTRSPICCHRSPVPSASIWQLLRLASNATSASFVAKLRAQSRP